MSIFSSIAKGIGSLGSAALGAFSKSNPLTSFASGALGSLTQFGQDSQNFGNSMALQQQGQQWQEHIIDKQNQWNSAPAQAERYRQAGINPVMALGGGSSGIVSSGGSSGVSNSFPVSDAVVMGNEFKRIQMEKELSDSQSEMNRAAAAKSAAEAETENKSRVLKLAATAKQEGLISSQTARNTAEANVLGEDFEFKRATQKYRQSQEFERTNQEVYRSLLAFSEAQIASFNAKHVGERFVSEQAQIYARIALSAAQGRAAEATAEAQKAVAGLNTVLANNQNYTDEQREQLLKATIQSIRAAAVSSGIDADWRQFDHIMNSVGSIINAGVGARKFMK